jgi:thioredoxin domain-containing protein 5
MQHKLDIAEVDCEANGALCTSQHIQGYPTLVFFNKDKSEYTGGRKLEQLMAFVNDVSAPYVPHNSTPTGIDLSFSSPVRELADENLEKQIASNAVMFLLLHTKSNNDIVVRPHLYYLP